MYVKKSKSKSKSSCFMAGGIRRTVRKRKGRPYWYVFWTENGKQERKSTEVLIVQNGLEEDETLHLAHSKAASMFGSEDNRDVIIANEDLKAARKKLDIARGGVNQPTIEVYFENLKLTGKPKTLENKRIVVSRFLKFLGKDVKKKVDFITKDKLQQFFNLLSKDHAANTIKTMRDYLRACLTEALEKHYIPQNPFTGLELPKFDKKEAKLTRYRYIPTCETVAEMMKRLPDPWPTVIWLTLQTCGQRIGDIVRCKWESFKIFMKYCFSFLLLLGIASLCSGDEYVSDKTACSLFKEGSYSSPLHRAAFDADSGRLVDLVRIGEHVDCRENEEGTTPLMVAAQYGHEECVAVLLRLGADPNARDAVGNTPLMYAGRPEMTSRSKASIVRMLLTAGAEVNVQNNNGVTPLLACLYGCNPYEIARILIEAGADASIRTNDGEGCLDIMSSGNESELRALLISAGAEE